MVSSYSRQNLDIRTTSFFNNIPLSDDKNKNAGQPAAMTTPSPSSSFDATTATAESVSSIEGSTTTGILPYTTKVLDQLLMANGHPFDLLLGCGNPYSAIFKIRICSECGRHCTKLEGYNKELVEEKVENINVTPGQTTTIIEPPTKVYYHKWCSQIKEYRQEHSKKYSLVMHVLYVSHYRALVNAHRLREAAEQTTTIVESPKKKKNKHTSSLVNEQHQHDQPLSHRFRPIVIPEFVKQIKVQSQIYNSSIHNHLPVIIDSDSDSDSERDFDEQTIQQKPLGMIMKLKERVSSKRRSSKSIVKNVIINDDDDTLLLDPIFAVATKSTSVSISTSNNINNNNTMTMLSKKKKEKKSFNNSKLIRKLNGCFQKSSTTTTTLYDDNDDTMNRVSKVVVAWSFPEP